MIIDMESTKFAEFLQRLIKEKGNWRNIAIKAELHPNTLMAIARGRIPNPGVKTVDAIYKAMNSLKPEATNHPE